MKISYGITVHNEHEELNKLLEFLIHKTHENDEIVICDDYSNEDTQFVLQSWSQQYGHAKLIKIYQRKLDGDFSAQKNSVIENCDGDYIFHIDADEIPHENLINILPKMVETNDVDLVWVPRVNTVEGLTDEHCVKWGWRVTKLGWVNYPDYQARIFRNSPEIKWTKPVHEHITGCKTYAHLPPQEELSLYHHKTIDKQEKQNKLYEDILNYR
jgi:glycosyltransferase involved in cell wall biosynthesis